MPQSVNITKGDAQIIEWGWPTMVDRQRIHDLSKHWLAHQWRGFSVRLRGGTNDCIVQIIEDNDDHHLALRSALPFNPEEPIDCVYEIFAGAAVVDRMDVLDGQLRNLVAQQSETNLLLGQLRWGLGHLVGQSLESVDPAQTQ